jgi:hypothetical protein
MQMTQGVGRHASLEFPQEDAFRLLACVLASMLRYSALPRQQSFDLSPIVLRLSYFRFEGTVSLFSTVPKNSPFAPQFKSKTQHPIDLGPLLPTFVNDRCKAQANLSLSLGGDRCKAQANLSLSLGGRIPHESIFCSV